MKKNKQLNPLEQHFEKLVLAGVSLVLLAVVAMQFLTQPNAVKVGNSEPVPPDRVFQVVKGEADQLIAKMRSVSPELPEVPEQDVATRFSEVSKLAIADSISMERIASTTTIGSAAADGAGIDAATTYTLPQVPVPARVAAVSYRATVDPIVWASNEELRPYLPAEQPFDLGAISIEGVVSGESLRRSLEEDPDGDEGPLRPLPLSWWKGSVDLLGVEVEREEQGPDGGWTGSTIVSGLPGGVSLLADIRREGVTPADVQRVAQQAEAVIREVAQPSFPPTIAGPEWVPPSKSSAQEPQGEENREQALLQRQADSLQRQIAAKEEQLADAGGGEPGAQDERGRGGRGGRGVREGGGGASDREERERAQLQKELESLRREHEQVLDKLEASGAQVDRAARTGREAAEPPLPELLEAKDLPVWVHDVSAEPGKVYRYRMRAVVNNPLFARGQFLAEEQQGAAASPVLEGEWSEWSPPVAMEADQHFFVVSASQDDALGSPPRAAVEVYEFYYGYWRKASTTLEPGDTVHARAKLPDSLVIYDPARLEELASQPAGRRGREPEESTRGVRRGLPEDEPSDERGRIYREGAPPEEAEEGAAGAELPPGATKADPWLELSVPAMLLDVARVPGDEGRFQAVLRGPDGQISVRDAESDRTASLYRRLAASAREGETQGQPRSDPNANRPKPAEEERRTRDIEPEGGGEGGGGGGG